MSREYQIYPRGFLGAVRIESSVDIARGATAVIDSQKFHFGSKTFASPKKPPSNKVIDTLYREYIGNSHQANTFQFYERVLAAAFDAFGTNNFREWLSAQAQANSTDYLHAKFLQDTLNFIVRGKREMMIDNWLPILSSNREMQNTVSNIDKTNATFKEMLVLADEYFGKPEIKDNELKVIFFDWVRQKNGITDLLKTVHIFFGG